MSYPEREPKRRKKEESVSSMSKHEDSDSDLDSHLPQQNKRDNVESIEYWDIDNEHLLQKTSLSNRQLFKLCHEKSGLVPDQLLPDGEFVNESGPISYTSNWNGLISKKMILLLFCPIFQKDHQVLQYAISLAIFHGLPGRQIPCSDCLYEDSKQKTDHRSRPLAFVENIKSAVDRKQAWSYNDQEGVVVRDLTAVVDSWDKWVDEERIRAEEWNQESPEDFIYPDELWQTLGTYHKECRKSSGRLERDSDPDAPLRLKKAWIIRQRKEALLSTGNILPEIGETEVGHDDDEDEDKDKGKNGIGGHGDGQEATDGSLLDPSDKGIMESSTRNVPIIQNSSMVIWAGRERTATNGLSYVDLTIESDNEEDANQGNDG